MCKAKAIRQQRQQRGHQSGSSYVEVLIALVVLGVCLVPALNAASASLAAAPALTASSKDLVCVKSHMEKIMAEPYSNLLNAAVAAGSVATASSYSPAADTVCPARQAFFARYDPTNASNPFAAADTGLLFVKVAVADGSVNLTTLVARP